MFYTHTHTHYPIINNEIRSNFHTSRGKITAKTVGNKNVVSLANRIYTYDCRSLISSFSADIKGPIRPNEYNYRIPFNRGTLLPNLIPFDRSAKSVYYSLGFSRS